jgi:hypothetical protein
MKKIIPIIALSIVVCLFMEGCGYKGEKKAGQTPFVLMYNVPADSSEMGAAPILWWWGTDRDGIILYYEYIDIVKSELLNSADYVPYYLNSIEIPDSVSLTTGKTSKWVKTSKNLDTLFFSLLPTDSVTEHLFCIRSVDSDSDRSVPECKIYFRTNDPPDSLNLKEFEGFEENDSFWVLRTQTQDWPGIPFSWKAHDPDNSVILEYYWEVVDFDNPSIVVRTSLVEDTLGGVYSGRDTTDGWVRSTSTVVKDIPTGHWKFHIKVRDDAFYVGAETEWAFYAYHPYFDPTDSIVAYDRFNNTFHDSVLAIFSTTAWSPAVTTFYTGILERLKSEGLYFDDYYVVEGGIEGFGSGALKVNKSQLYRYSVVYLVNLGGFLSAAGSSALNIDGWTELKDYSYAGGRVIADGRGMFNLINSVFGLLTPFGSPPYELFGVTAQFATGQLKNVTATHPEYNGLELDSTKIFPPSDRVSGVNAIGIYPYFSGIPYAEPLYNASPYDGADDVSQANLIGLPIACRFAKETTRSVFFGFNLYSMKNDHSQVDDVLKTSFLFIRKSFQPDTGEVWSF